VIWYSMTRDVQETRGHAAARSMRRESRAETRERVERELRKREERAATRERQWWEARERAAGSQAPSRRRSRREGQRARSLTSNGKMQHDRAWPARHEGPVLPPSGSVSQVLNCARASRSRAPRSSSIRHQAQSPPLPSPPCLSLAGAARLLRGGAPWRLLAAASPDPCVVWRGHSSFPPARGQQYCIRGRHRPHARSLGLGVCGPENRGRLGRGVERGLA
jgi:hypothetical protein